MLKIERGKRLTIKILNFKENEQVITILKYHGKNRFYLSSDIVKALNPDDELAKGDEMMIKILAINKINGIGDSKK